MASSWAAIATRKAPAAAPAPAAADLTGVSVLVVDANALINGVRLEGVAERVVTTAEVLDEIRDAKTRAFVAALPYEIHVMEPSEESCRAVLNFARATGEIAALSAVDQRVIALAHTLELRAHGAARLRSAPAPARVAARGARSKGQRLPGWGSVPNPEDWEEIDEINAREEVEVAALLAGARAAGGAGGEGAEAAAAAAAAAEEGAAAAASTADGGPKSRVAARPEAIVQEEEAAPPTPARARDEAAPASPAVGAAAGAKNAQKQPQPAPAAEEHEGGGDDDDGDGDSSSGGSGSGDAEEEEDDGGGWTTAARSRTAQRRRARRTARREAHRVAFEAEWADHAEAVARDAAASGGAGAGAGAGGSASASAAAPVMLTPEEAAEGVAWTSEGPVRLGDVDEEDEEEEGEGSGAGSEQEEADEDEDEENGSSGEEDEASAAGDEAAAAATTKEGGAHAHAHAPEDEDGGGGDEGGDDDEATGRSSVAVATADYAMQNVLLQMGLRLVTRDGRVVNRLSRWALRCGACFGVTREPGRIFCPKCGNMPLDKVEVVTGPGGQEVFGARRRHVLRGTRYSLPKPRGGRAGTAANPILREDVFLQKVKALGGSRAPRRSAAAVDAFAPEYGADTWHEGAPGGGGGGGGGGNVAAAQRSQRELAQHRGAAGLVVPSWRRNPNEPKMRRSNRRK